MDQVVTPQNPETPEQQTHRSKSVTAMVLGIASLVVVWFPLIGLILSIIGFTLSRTNRRYAADNCIPENSMNTAGYVCSLVGLIAGIITVILAIVVIAGLVAVAGGVFNYIILPEIM